MKRRRIDLLYVLCVCALLWLAKGAVAAAPPNGSGCPGKAKATGQGPAGTVDCGTNKCFLNMGNCKKTVSANVDPVNDPIQLYRWNGVAWARAGMASAGSNYTECYCKIVLDDGTIMTLQVNPDCCHLVEVTKADGSKRPGTRGKCATCPTAGRCFVTGPANGGEADCAVN